MRRRSDWSRWFTARGVVVSIVVSALAPALALAQPLPPVRLSVATDGTEANGASSLIAATPDGRTILFWSSATNLVPGDTNGLTDLFVRDRDTDRDGTFDEAGAVRTVRVSVGPAGQLFGDSATTGILSPDGRFVLFTSATAFVPGDTNGATDGFLYDRDLDADGIFDEPGAAGLSLVTSGNGGALALGGDSTALELSADGRYVLFQSRATNLQPRPTTRTQLYRKDRVTSLTALVSSSPDGTPADLDVTGTMSPDGHLVMLAGGFAALMPVSMPSAAAFPWALRDVDANTFTPIAFPSLTASRLPLAAATPPASGQPITGNIAVNYAAVEGFSADGTRAYLSEQTFACCLVSYHYGTTFEYDLAAGRITRRVPGITPNTSTIDRRDPRGFTMISGEGTAASYPAFTVSDLSRFDATTGRIRALVSQLACAGADSAGGRTLFRDGLCGPTPFLLDERYGVPLPMPAPVTTGRLDASGSTVFFSSDDATILPGGADTNATFDVFAVDLLSRFDRDADGLDDRWEIAMGLDYTSSAGAEGATGDPDGDGLTNSQEQTAGSHPRGAARQFLAEGADNAFFKTRLAIGNPGATAATAVVRLDGDDGTATHVNVHVPAGGRRTIFVDEIAGHGPSFSTTVESSLPLVSERTMSWDAREYGAHAERASNTPATQWFLAEGATGAFSLFYLLQNPGDVAATATVRYLRPSPLAPIDRTYTLPPHSRTTLPVGEQAPALAATDVSAAITATQPILVERAMYRSVAGQPFAAGHASAGVTAAATTWFLAEGATGPFFDLFILLANPTVTNATVEIRYLLDGGTVLTKTYAVAAESRRTIYVDAEDFPSLGQALANVAVSCAITSTNAVPIVVERSMWFPGADVTPNFWTEAHNSPGATAAARRWVLADGEAGGSKATQTYVLIANTSSTPGRARLTVLPDLTTTPVVPAFAVVPPITVMVDLPPNSRTTVPMHTVQGLAEQRFGVLVESIDTAPLADLVVERAMYWNSGAEVWSAGTNLLATPIP